MTHEDHADEALYKTKYNELRDSTRTEKAQGGKTYNNPGGVKLQPPLAHRVPGKCQYPL